MRRDASARETMRSALLAAATLLFGTVAEGAKVPLPPGVSESELDEPFELVLGAQPTKVQVYASRISADGLRRFYEQALPKAGWTVNVLPWMSQVQEASRRMEEELAQHPEKLREEGMGQQVQLARTQLRAFEEHMQNAIYAVRGSERLLLRFMPEAGQTVVGIHRWEADSSGVDPFTWLQGPGGGPAGPQGPEQLNWPHANPCCSGQGVPNDLRRMPQSVPRYPNGRIVSSGAGPGQAEGGQAVMEFYSSPDPVEQVVEFYRTQMAYNGWQLQPTSSSLTGPGDDFDGTAASFKTEMLKFRNERALCLIGASQYWGLPGDDRYRNLLPPEYLESLPPEVAEMMRPGAEQTVIVVHYMELDPELLRHGLLTR